MKPRTRGPSATNIRPLLLRTPEPGTISRHDWSAAFSSQLLRNQHRSLGVLSLGAMRLGAAGRGPRNRHFFISIREFVFLIIGVAVFSLVFVIVVIVGRIQVDGVQQNPRN